MLTRTETAILGAVSRMRMPRPLLYSCVVSALLAGCGRLLAAPPPFVPAAHATKATRDKRAFTIAAGDATASLAAFSTQSSTAIVYLVEHVRGVRTQDVRGVFTPREALERMLAQTPLHVVEDAHNGALIVKRRERPPATSRDGSSASNPDQPNTPPMNERRTTLFNVLTGWLALAGATSQAQTAATPASPPANTDAVQLSPFEVVAEDDRSYQAANTLGATRTNVAIRDLPMQINVVTEQLMVDRALFDLEQVLDVMPGTARTFNEFIPQVNIRGFDSSAAMRNGVRGLTTPDMNSIARVETVKGPAALLYGQTQPGGVINYITKNPSPTRKTTVRLSAGSDQLFRSELDTTGPINQAKTFNYRLGATYYTVEKAERQRSLDRVSFAPMVQWKPFQHTSMTVRYSYTHDDIRPAEGLALKPTGAINRGGDPSYFYPFNGLDAPSNPQWVNSVGPDFIKDSPSSYRDYKPVVWELEATQRLNRAMDLRLNFAYHRRARSSIREGGTGLVNPWTQANPTIAQLGGRNSWNLDNTPGDPFPEAQFTYEFIGRGNNPAVGDPLADTRLLNGVPYVYNPAVRTLQYVDGVSGWRRANWIGNNRRERRVNGQIDLVTRFKVRSISNTLLTGFEHNQDRVWENNSTLVRDPALGTGGATFYTVPGTSTQIPNIVDYFYNIFDPASTAARDAFARRNVLPLSGFTSNGTNNDQRYTSNAFYANWSAQFYENRGRLAVGGRYDDVSARNSTKNPGTNPIGFDGVVTSTIEGARKRTTPQAGLSFRINDPVTVYVLYSQSVNPRVQFQPARTAARETQLLTRYQQDGLPAPDLDALPWGQLLEPEFGKSFEYGVKTDLFGNKVMVNLAYYVIDKKNVSRGKPAADPDSAVGFLDLSGAEEARGLDVDFYARPIRGLQIGGGGLYNKTEIVAVNAATLATPLATTFAANAGPNAPYSLLGKRTPNAAKWSGNGYVRYEFQEGAIKGLGVGLSYVFMGARREGDTLRWSEPWSRYDFNANYRKKILNRMTSFGLVVRNLTDRDYRADRDTFAQPRQFVGSVGFEF